MAGEQAIERVGKVSTGKQLKVAPTEIANKERFDNAMDHAASDKTTVTTQELEPERSKTFMEQVRDLNYKADQAKGSTPEELVAQAKDIIDEIEQIKTKLDQPEIKVKDSARTLLRNKLEHIDENLRIALNKVGAEYIPAEPKSSLAKPIERFLGMLSNSQHQLENLAGEVKGMHSREDLNPASMLLIQIKVAQVQQQLELFTNVLNKALESTKTIMNVQV